MPLTLDIVKIGNDGELKTEKLTTRGRAYSLQKVMDKLLLTQERAGYLRSAFPEDGDINVIRKELESKGEGFFTAKYNQNCKQPMPAYRDERIAQYYKCLITD